MSLFTSNSTTPFPKVHFLIPDPEQLVSGGNIYNLHLMNALRDQGISTERIDGHYFQVPPRFSSQQLLIVDTLFLDQSIPMLREQTVKTWYAILLVHHLASLYPPKHLSSMAFFEQNEKAALMEFDAFLTTSTFTKHYLQKRQLQAPILVVPPALTHTFPPIQRSPQPIKAIIIANLVERKGILPFFKALVSMGIEKYTDHLTIDIYGTDQIEKSYAQSCLSYIEQHPALQKVVIYQGTRSQSQLITIYQQANLLLSTSFMESFGMALQEAVAAQLPILTLAAGNAQHHIQPGSNGFVCSDLMHLTQKLFHLASTPSALAQLLQQAQQYQPYRNYRWANAAQQFKDQFLDNCKDYCYI